jgi:hypothetical protein
MNYKYFIPTRESEFHAWAGNFTACVQQRRIEWRLDAGDVEELKRLFDAYSASYAAWADPGRRTTVVVAEKNALKKELREAIKATVRELQGSRRMTDAGRRELAITVRKTPASPGSGALAGAASLRREEARADEAEAPPCGHVESGESGAVAEAAAE